MTPTTGTQPPKTDLRRSQLDRSTAMRLAGTEYARFADSLEQLAPGDWTLPTDCPGWDVQTVAGHVLRMAEMAASVRDGARQLRAASKAGGVFLDSLTALQVREHAGLTPAELRSKLPRSDPERRAADDWRPASSAIAGCRSFRRWAASRNGGRSDTSPTPS